MLGLENHGHTTNPLRASVLDGAKLNISLCSPEQAPNNFASGQTSSIHAFRMEMDIPGGNFSILHIQGSYIRMRRAASA